MKIEKINVINDKDIAILFKGKDDRVYYSSFCFLDLDIDGLIEKLQETKEYVEKLWQK